LTTFAVAVILIVTGLEPQLKRMIPPRATARTTAAEVQLAAVPLPMTVVARRVSTARAAAGTGALPAGLPKVAGATATGAALRVGLGVGVGDGFFAGALGEAFAVAVRDGVAAGTVAVIVPLPDGAAASPAGTEAFSGWATEAAGAGSEPQPARAATVAAVTTMTAGRLRTRAP
jgi:hypothetical protein